MNEIKLVEIRAMREILALGHIRVKPEQRRFTKNLFLTYLQTRHPAVTSYRIDVAEESIGYVMLIHAENPLQWIIDRLAISAEHQRQGYGHAVADQLIDMVHDFENSEMVIARYAPSNDDARRLFGRLKFVEQEKMFRGRHIAVLEFEFEEVEEVDEDDDDDSADDIEDDDQVADDENDEEPDDDIEEDD